MFKSAVQNHNAIASASPTNTAYKQASLGSVLDRTGSQTSSTRPVGSGMKTPVGTTAQGTKRTSSGLAKSLSSHEDDFEYPTMTIVGSEKENELPAAYHMTSRNNPGILPQALFDEDDFDSDIDLDVEDPATKGTVTYPTLPRVTSDDSADSGYNSRAQTADVKPELGSSQPIPWSSSPLSHYKTPQRPDPPKSKRRTLPMGTESRSRNLYRKRREQEETTHPRKRVSKAVDRPFSTPAKDSKSQSFFNTTASALKQQRTTFREANKAQAKAHQGTDEDMKEAIKKKKKNTIHKIFLSEEQQNVLNLVAEYKKSVFFTGSAGTGKSVLLREIIAALRRKYAREPDRVAVTASTGLAACNIGGVTLHSFAGIGLGKEPVEDLAAKRLDETPKQSSGGCIRKY
ncbi:unnamed protein product [Alternaria alternata]